MTELLDIAQRIAGRAHNGEQIEAYVARGRQFNVKAYGGEVESLTSAESAGIGVRVIKDGRQGFAHAGTLDETAIDQVLDDARDNVQFGEPDKWYALTEPDGVEPVELDLYSPELATMAPDRKVAFALDLERMVKEGDPRISGVRLAMWADGVGEAAIASSTGVSTWSQGSSCYVMVQSLASENGETQTGYGLDVGRRADDIDLVATAHDAVDRATRLLGAKQAPSQRLTIVLDRRVASDFFSIIGGMLTGDVVLKQRSPFADRLGDTIASPLVSLLDDATNPLSFGADTHDGEGLATRPTALIDKGVLKAFLHNSYTGRRSGQGTTASAVRGYSSAPGVGCLALVPSIGTKSQDELITDVGEGLLVQSVTGLHSGVNPISGDFSVGADGMMIRGGAVAEPVREITIASTLQKMLLDVVAVGGDLEWLPGGDAGVSLVIRDVSLSGS